MIWSGISAEAFYSFILSTFAQVLPSIEAQRSIDTPLDDSNCIKR